MNHAESHEHEDNRAGAWQQNAAEESEQSLKARHTHQEDAQDSGPALARIDLPTQTSNEGHSNRRSEFDGVSREKRPQDDGRGGQEVLSGEPGG
ncbi:hypothetical protein [Deinococcus sp. QL22]|uniref:hypothetical protein n=1 Tax=Deinococcus sp. QL22 TaxID=2939437 RepID=UPI0020179E33|nr:hypothetical protein [Deinococcus sp. QL22]UQN09097.1 hypothetical protein M1R55_23925 [Deinococcus sp. QL22]